MSRSPSAKVAAASANAGGGGGVRTKTILLVSCARVMVGVARMAFSFFVVALATEFSWSTADQGRVKASFAFGYLFTQIPGGMAGDRIGNKIFQVLALLSCAVATMVIPTLIAATGPESSPWIVEAACTLMGFCCGAQHPTMTALMKKWCLPAEKNWVSSMESLATVSGSLINCLFVAYLTAALGWRNAMYCVSALNWVALAGIMVVADAPTASGGWMPLSAEEAALYRAEGMLADEPAGGSGAKKGKKSAAAKTGGSAVALFTSVGTWVLILSHAMYNFARYTFEQEMPKFYSEQLSAEKEVGLHLSTLHIAAFAFSLLAKGVVDSLGLSPIGLRRTAIVGGYGVLAAGCAVLAFMATRETLPSAYTFTLCLDVLWMGLTAQSFGHMGNYYDITSTNTGLLMGVGNTFATLPSYLSPLFVANILQSSADTNQAWAVVFSAIGGFALLTALLYSMFVVVDVVDEPQQGKAKKA